MSTALISLAAAVLLTAAMAPPAPPPGSDGHLPPLHTGSAVLTCPVGGERFTAVTTNMWSVTGQRPDEKPYSEVPFPRPLAECPSNGLVIFADFTPAETAELAKWIATPVYQAMRKTQSPFYRAYWLAMKIHRPEGDAIEQLLPAIWEAKEDDGKDPRRPLTTRYQRVLIDAVEKVSPAVSLDDRIWLRGQAANALREMGKFDAAERMRQSAEADLPHATRPALGVYLQKLKAVIARHDRSDEPLDMIPDVQAALICRDTARRDAFDRAYCERPAIASIFPRVDPNGLAEVARRGAQWERIESDAQACHLKVVNKKVVSEDAVELHLTYRLEPDTPEAKQCFYQRAYNKGAAKS